MRRLAPPRHRRLHRHRRSGKVGYFTKAPRRPRRPAALISRRRERLDLVSDDEEKPRTSSSFFTDAILVQVICLLFKTISEITWSRMNKGSPVGSGVRTKSKMLPCLAHIIRYIRRKQLSTLEHRFERNMKQRPEPEAHVPVICIWPVGKGSGIWRELKAGRGGSLEPAGSRDWLRRTATWCTRNLSQEDGRGVDGDGPHGDGDQGRQRGWELELAIGLLPPPPPRKTRIGLLPPPPPPPRKTRGDGNWNSRDGDLGRFDFFCNTVVAMR